jgi:hypothetical protein
VKHVCKKTIIKFHPYSIDGASYVLRHSSQESVHGKYPGTSKYGHTCAKHTIA